MNQALQLVIQKCYHAAMSLSEIRQAKGLSQRKFSEKSGLAQPMVSRIESPSANPTLETIRIYAKAMEMPAYQVVAILCGEEKMIQKSCQ